MQTTDFMPQRGWGLKHGNFSTDFSWEQLQNVRGYEKADKYREPFGVFFRHGPSNNDAGPAMRGHSDTQRGNETSFTSHMC